MPKPQIKLIKTEDGSHSLYREDLDEPYHSTYGAINESNHVFIDAGLRQFSDKNEIHIFEMGLGTGLNALLTAVYALDNNIGIHYTSVEAFPPEKELLEQLNYADIIKHTKAIEIFEGIHASAFEKETEINSHFTLKKHHSSILDLSFEKEHFDLVFFDAFNPDLQPELWSEAVFAKLYKAMNEGGILTTYSCKGIVKRALKAVGFKIEKIPGPKGKREMLRAYRV